MEFKFNKKRSKNQIKSVVENKFMNELVRDENNKQVNVSSLNEFTNFLGGVDKSLNTFGSPYFNNKVVVPILLTSSEIVDDLILDRHYKSEVKQICEHREKLNYEEFSSDLKCKQLRKTLISLFTENVIPLVINESIASKCNKSTAGKIVYGLNLPSIIGTMSTSVIDTAINKCELKYNIKKDKIGKIESTKYYLGKYKYGDNTESNFYNNQKTCTKNKIMGSLIGSAISESLTLTKLVMDKRKSKYDQQQPIQSE